MSVPANVIYFVGYDYLRDIIQPYSQLNHADYSPLAAGAIARTIAVTMISPIELFRTRLQATATTDVNDFKRTYYVIIYFKLHALLTLLFLNRCIRWC